MEQPQVLSYQAINELLSEKPRAPAVTIYLPTHISASPPHMSEDQIRLKNIKNKAIKILNAREERASKFAEELDRSLESFLSDTVFWER